MAVVALYRHMTCYVHILKQHHLIMSSTFTKLHTGTKFEKSCIQYCETNRRKFKFQCGILIKNSVFKDIVKLKLSTVFPHKLICHQREKRQLLHKYSQGPRKPNFGDILPKEALNITNLAKTSLNGVCMANLRKSITIIVIKISPPRVTQVTTAIAINYLISTIKRLIINAVIRKLDEPFNYISKD